MPAEHENGAAGASTATRDPSRWSTLGEWLILAWALVWLWAYVQTALAERFPQWFSWTTRLW